MKLSIKSFFLCTAALACTLSLSSCPGGGRAAAKIMGKSSSSASKSSAKLLSNGLQAGTELYMQNDRKDNYTRSSYRNNYYGKRSSYGSNNYYNNRSSYGSNNYYNNNSSYGSNSYY